jgi:hypothetical protein
MYVNILFDRPIEDRHALRWRLGTTWRRILAAPDGMHDGQSLTIGCPHAH